MAETSGKKQTLADTGRKFYDLNRDPVVSPYSGKSWPLSFFEESSVTVGVSDEIEPEPAVSTGIYGLAFFSSRIDQGAMLLAAALVDSGPDRRPPYPYHSNNQGRSWFESLVIHCRNRSAEVRQALVVDWEPTGRAAELAFDAFMTLSHLTQASLELQRLCKTDRARAFNALANHLDVATQQFELNAKIIAEIEELDALPAAPANRLDTLQADLLMRAGGGLSLTDASNRLHVSRQALHKRVKTRSALAMMRGSELVFPMAQWVSRDGEFEWINGLPSVLKLFHSAGDWSALQFLIEEDPNLGTSPRLALIDGRIAETVGAAEAYLGMEGDI